MHTQSITLRGDASRLLCALDEFSALMSGGELELDGDLLSPDLRELLRHGFLDVGFEASKLVRVDSNPTAGRAGYVLVSLEPSNLFLELLSALRARDCNGR